MSALPKQAFTSPYDVVMSIERHLRRDDHNLQRAAKEFLDNCIVPELSKALADKDDAEAGRLLRDGADDFLFMQADEMAERFLAGDMLAEDESKLRDWAPFKHRNLGRRYAMGLL